LGVSLDRLEVFTTVSVFDTPFVHVGP
jgi:hypothetical protein